MNGLNDLSEGERNLFAALVLCGGAGGCVKPGDLKQHPLAAGLTHPTYHRMLRGLVERGIVEYVAEPTDGRGYRIVWQAAVTEEKATARAQT